MTLTSDWAIRQAEPADAPVLAALAIEVWLHTYAAAGIEPLFADHALRTFTADQMALQVSAGDRTVFVCHAGDRLLGFASLLHCPDRAISPGCTTELERLYVLPTLGRSGIGRALIGACEARLRERRERGYWLRAYAGNDRALAFYDRMGFERCGTDLYELGDRAYENVLFARLVDAAVAR